MVHEAQGDHWQGVVEDNAGDQGGYEVLSHMHSRVGGAVVARGAAEADLSCEVVRGVRPWVRCDYQSPGAEAACSQRVKQQANL
jgi:hypothetical protein